MKHADALTYEKICVFQGARDENDVEGIDGTLNA